MQSHTHQNIKKLSGAESFTFQQTPMHFISLREKTHSWEGVWSIPKKKKNTRFSQGGFGENKNSGKKIFFERGMGKDRDIVGGIRTVMCQIQKKERERERGLKKSAKNTSPFIGGRRHSQKEMFSKMNLSTSRLLNIGYFINLFFVVFFVEAAGD